jgi:L-iditol 2-dehydrogenase
LNRLARYIGNGLVEIVEEPMPECPTGGLLIKTEACGLCSGELMAWYMDRKLPHVLGHEVAGIVVESDDSRFPEGARVYPHHHAPCLQCDYCNRGMFVRCEQWKRTKLQPGGMAEYFAVSAENLNDTHVVSDLRAIDAALVEPLSCVAKAIGMTSMGPNKAKTAVIGLGFMGLLHALILEGCHAFDLNPDRLAWAQRQGVITPDMEATYDRIFVMPGSQAAFDRAYAMSDHYAQICLFAPLPPEQDLKVPGAAYFNDLRIFNAYSAGPPDSVQAINWLCEGRVRADQVVTEFIPLTDLPRAYRAMRDGEILKPMVVFN